MIKKKKNQKPILLSFDLLGSACNLQPCHVDLARLTFLLSCVRLGVPIESAARKQVVRNVSPVLEVLDRSTEITYVSPTAPTAAKKR